MLCVLLYMYIYKVEVSVAWKVLFLFILYPIRRWQRTQYMYVTPLQTDQ